MSMEDVLDTTVGTFESLYGDVLRVSLRNAVAQPCDYCKKYNPDAPMAAHTKWCDLIVDLCCVRCGQTQAPHVIFTSKKFDHVVAITSALTKSSMRAGLSAVTDWARRVIRAEKEDHKSGDALREQMAALDKHGLSVGTRYLLSMGDRLVADRVSERKLIEAYCALCDAHLAQQLLMSRGFGTGRAAAYLRELMDYRLIPQFKALVEDGASGVSRITVLVVRGHLEDLSEPASKPVGLDE